MSRTELLNEARFCKKHHYTVFLFCFCSSIQNAFHELKTNRSTPFVKDPKEVRGVGLQMSRLEVVDVNRRGLMYALINLCSTSFFF